jgi:glycosyltransferase involved in cell wall biosynthesis
MKFVYLTQNNQWNSPRVYYKQAKRILRYFPDIEVFFIDGNNSIKVSDKSATKWWSYRGKISKIRFINRLKREINVLSNSIKTIQQAKRISPDILQACHIREIVMALAIKKIVNCYLIYDAREDYFNQIFEYGERQKRKFLEALFWSAIEIAFARHFDYLFCTDDWLYDKYRSSIYGCKRVELLRNFSEVQKNSRKVKYENKNELRLVYIGSVNEYRGVKETAEYVEKFNKLNWHQKRIMLDIYSQKNELIEALEKRKLVTRYSYLEYPSMMEKLADYDVGVFLGKRIKKYERNLPIKNFDYMAVGLPVITSNFGNMRKYMEEAKGGICIDPESYDDFENAIMKLFDVETRKKLGENGIRYTKGKGSYFEEEKKYLGVIREIIRERQKEL